MGSSTRTMATNTKVVICGDGAIGKTCLLDTIYGTEIVDWENPEYAPTAASNQLQTWDVEGMGEAAFEFWDTAGQEALVALRLEAYPGTQVLMIGFDMTNPDSLLNVQDNWIKEFTDECADCKAIILVGTKSDLHGERGGFDGDGGVKRADVMKVAIEIGAAAVCMTSARTKAGVVESGDPDFTNSDDGTYLKDMIMTFARMIFENEDIPVVVDTQAAAAPAAAAPAAAAPVPASVEDVPAPVEASPAPVAAAPAPVEDAPAPVSATAAPGPAAAGEKDKDKSGGCCTVL